MIYLIRLIHIFVLNNSATQLPCSLDLVMPSGSPYNAGGMTLLKAFGVVVDGAGANHTVDW